MAHFKKLPQKKNEDKIIYGDKIVNGIVLVALSEITYAELYSASPYTKNHSKAIKVYQDKDGVHIDVSVRVHFSQCVSDMAFKIQETVRHNIESMTEYKVASVNVIVKGVFFDNKKIETNNDNTDDRFDADKSEFNEDSAIEAPSADINEPAEKKDK